MTTATLERSSTGQFAKGNKGGPGNPYGRRLAAMREAVQRAISVEDIERLMRVLLEQAMTGDLGAAKLVLQYAVGKPKPVVEPDRVDVEEWSIQEESWVPPGEMTARLRDGIPVGLANAAMGDMADVRTEEMAEVFTNRAAAETYMDRFVDEDDRPLTPDEIEEAKREWREANERVEREMAGRPSGNGANGGNGSSGSGVEGEARGGSPGLEDSSRGLGDGRQKTGETEARPAAGSPGLSARGLGGKPSGNGANGGGHGAKKGSGGSGVVSLETTGGL